MIIPPAFRAGRRYAFGYCFGRQLAGLVVPVLRSKRKLSLGGIDAILTKSLSGSNESYVVFLIKLLGLSASMSRSSLIAPKYLACWTKNTIVISRFAIGEKSSTKKRRRHG